MSPLGTRAMTPTRAGALSSGAWVSSYSALHRTSWEGGGAGQQRLKVSNSRERLAESEHDRLETSAASGSDSDGHRRSCSRSSVGSCHSRSRENLWVDLEAKTGDPTSELFVESLMSEEDTTPKKAENHRDRGLSTILERSDVVGMARSSGPGSNTTLSSVFTLVASAMGAGCLSLPHMFRQSGAGLGVLLLVLGALLAHVSLVVLMSCARYTHSQSFADLVALGFCRGGRCSLTSGRAAWAALVVDAVIAFYGIAAVLIYMMLIGDFVMDIAESPAIGWTGASRGPLIVGSLLVVFPLSLYRQVSALRHVCILSTSAILLLTVAVIFRCPSIRAQREADIGAALGAVDAMDSTGSMEWFKGDWKSTLQSFAIAIFAFAAHTNAVPVVAALENPRAIRIWRVSLMSVLLELVVYVTIAFAGYRSFLGETQQDFIRNYPSDDALMLSVRCIYIVPVVFGVPINLAPAAASLQSLARRAAAHSALPLLGRHALGNCSELTLHAMIVSVVLGFCTLVAVYSEAVSDVIGLIGSFFGTLICLWWPLRIYDSVLGRLHSPRLALFLRSLLTGATCVGVLAFVSQLQEVVRSRVVSS